MAEPVLIATKFAATQRVMSVCWRPRARPRQCPPEEIPAWESCQIGTRFSSLLRLHPRRFPRWADLRRGALSAVDAVNTPRRFPR
jgi:hypothetical protein